MTKEERSKRIENILDMISSNNVEGAGEEYVRFANDFANHLAQSFIPYSHFEIPAIIAGAELLAKALRDSQPDAGQVADDIIANTSTFVGIESNGKIETYKDGEKVDRAKIFEGIL